MQKIKNIKIKGIRRRGVKAKILNWILFNSHEIIEYSMIKVSIPGVSVRVDEIVSLKRVPNGFFISIFSALKGKIMSIIRSVMSVVTYMKYRQFIKACKNPKAAQAKAWKKTFSKLANTSSVKHNLKDNRITEISDYEALFNAKSKSRFNPLTGEEILFWAQSAGTTGTQKIFPLSKSYQEQFQTSLPPFIYGFIKKYKNFLVNPSLYLAAIDPDEKAASGIPIGFISNYNYHHMPRFIKNIYVLPDKTLKNSKVFSKQGPLYALAGELNSIFAVTPLSIQKYMENIIINWTFFIEELEKENVSISESRLRHLRALDPDALTLKEIWPTLEFICCWKSSICKNQLRNMKDLLGGVAVHDAIYSATEGWINVPTPELPFGGPVHPRTHVVEFLDVEKEVLEENLIDLWELEKGKEYEIFITNNMGLVRYRIQDIVKCTGFFHRSPIIHFERKASSQISLGLVTISENELVQACFKLNIKLDENHYFTPNEESDGLVYCFSGEKLTREELINLNESLKEMNVNFKKYSENGTIKGVTQHRSKKSENRFHAQTKPCYLYQEYLG